MSMFNKSKRFECDTYKVDWLKWFGWLVQGVVGVYAIWCWLVLETPVRWPNVLPSITRVLSIVGILMALWLLQDVLLQVWRVHRWKKVKHNKYKGRYK